VDKCKPLFHGHGRAPLSHGLALAAVTSKLGLSLKNNAELRKKVGEMEVGPVGLC